MMLMFTNAMMYNSSDHDVYKMAVNMYDDVMLHIEVSTGDSVVSERDFYNFVGRFIAPLI